MEIDIKDVDYKKYITLTGKLDSNCSNEVTEKILDTVRENPNIVIDMKNCTYLSSAGLRTLLTIGKTIKLKSGYMSIINLVDDVKEIMEMTGFSSIFKSFEK
ncbi:STAS domain-containing protein [Clostridium sp. BJN0001]|uniref:STAS domain-containing protein n=1 Tax=Clostridium sp. BJN0001 TaxID=2930219 RepID=UPI001FD0710A|nr:STAS domain-containing protein [Clostridium sp. BJN0001]